MTSRLTVDKAKEMLKNPPHGKALSKKQIAFFQGVAHGMKPYEEGGWLERYADGGYIGLTNKPFNYNGAWGGQFQNGGSLPGSVGFTYARTGGTPSEGKYAKKTLYSAQDGTEIPLTDEEIKARYREYTQSPEWYAKSSGRAELTDSPIDMLLMGWAGGKGIEAGAQFIGKNIIPNIYKINPWRFKPDINAYYHRTPNIKNIINKETNMLQGFGSSEEGKLFSQSVQQRIPGKINLSKSANSELYFSKGTPLDWGRYNPKSKIKGIDLSGKPIYYSGQGYKGPYLVEAKNIPMKAASQGRIKNYSPTIPEGYAVPGKPILASKVKFYKEDWLKGYKEVPIQENGGFIPSAENGREMQYYQQGLDWLPKSISANGSTVPGNVQMKNQIINLNHLTDFSNFGNEINKNKWLSKYE